MLLTLYLAALGCIGFWPTPVDRPLSGFLDDVFSALHENLLTAGINYGVVEGTANVILFFPLGLFLALLLPVRRWGLAALAGLFTSVAIEAVQYLLLSQRQASLRDVMNNALGALLGALVVRLARTRPRAPNPQPNPGPGTPNGRSDMTTVADSADVAETASIGEGTRIWHLSQIREGAVLGKNCNIGRGAYVGPGVRSGG